MARTAKQIADAFQDAWEEFGDDVSTEFLAQITAERLNIEAGAVYDALQSVYEKRP